MNLLFTFLNLPLNYWLLQFEFCACFNLKCLEIGSSLNLPLVIQASVWRAGAAIKTSGERNEAEYWGRSFWLWRNQMFL